MLGRTRPRDDVGEEGALTGAPGDGGDIAGTTGPCGLEAQRLRGSEARRLGGRKRLKDLPAVSSPGAA